MPVTSPGRKNIRNQRTRATGNGDSRPRWYLICRKGSGATRFRVEADGRGRLPVERAASLLALTCLARQEDPRDFVVLPGPPKPLPEAVAELATELLHSALDTGGVALSRREQQVLGAVLENLSNKEIAARLGISERTVKFHVSALLSKFGVRTRVELMRSPGTAALPANGHRWLPLPVAEPPAEVRSAGSTYRETVGLDVRTRNAAPAPRPAAPVVRFPRPG
jgi:DNA-binding CsgD family transcriptional regulator